MVSSHDNGVLDQKRDLSIIIEEGMRYDSQCLKTIFKIAGERIKFEIRDLNSSAPFTVMRMIL